MRATANWFSVRASSSGRLTPYPTFLAARLSQLLPVPICKINAPVEALNRKRRTRLNAIYAQQKETDSRPPPKIQPPLEELLSLLSLGLRQAPAEARQNLHSVLE